MDKQIINRYGPVKDIKYLITSISDLKETVDTVRSIIETGCEEKDIIRAAESVLIEFFPLKNTLSSFILGLKMPHRILSSKYNRNVDKLPISFENIRPAIKTVRLNTMISYKLQSFLDLAQATTHFFAILQKITPRVEYYSIKKNIIIKTGKIAKISSNLNMLFIIHSAIINHDVIDSLMDPQKISP